MCSRSQTLGETLALRGQLLLACVTCNPSIRPHSSGASRTTSGPTRQHASSASYSCWAGCVAPHSVLAVDTVRARRRTISARRTLDKYPAWSHSSEPAEQIRRWLRRLSRTSGAFRQRVLTASGSRCEQHRELRQLIVDNAVSRGMFSIWWTAFAANRFRHAVATSRQAFIGTCPNSFDASGNPQARPGGQL
jgi:hypothetical protein